MLKVLFYGDNMYAGKVQHCLFYIKQAVVRTSSCFAFLAIRDDGNGVGSDYALMALSMSCLEKPGGVDTKTPLLYIKRWCLASTEIYTVCWP